MGDSSPLLKAGAQVMGSRAQSKQLGMEALMYERQAKDVDLQAVQMGERRREELRATMASYIASRAAKGLSLDSPSGVAVEKELQRQARRDEAVDRVGFGNQAYALRTSALMRRKGAKNANTAGWIAAGGSLIDGAANAFSAGAGGGR